MIASALIVINIIIMASHNLSTGLSLLWTFQMGWVAAGGPFVLTGSTSFLAT